MKIILRRAIQNVFFVIPAEAGIQASYRRRPVSRLEKRAWTPAYAGVTENRGIRLCQIILLNIAVALWMTFPGAYLQAQEEQRAELTPQSRRAVEKGMAALAGYQAEDGSFIRSEYQVATTALAGLAFLSGGNAPGRGKYGANVLKCVEYLLRHSHPSGYIQESLHGEPRTGGNSGMHGHGYAMLFLSQAYGMIPPSQTGLSARVREVLTRAVRLSEQSQSKGGWTYGPNGNGDEGSVTITQVQALRAAHDAGIKVNAETMKKAVEYINQTTSDWGQTQYSLALGGSTPGLTAAGMCVLTHLGEYQNPKVQKGLDYLLANYMPGSPENGPHQGAFKGFYFYSNFYAAQAMHQAGGKYWRQWWPAIRDSIVGCQDPDGMWKKGEGRDYGEAFTTSIALFILQMPNQYLPILWKTGAGE